MQKVFTKKITFSIPPSELFRILSDAEAGSRATGSRLKGNAVPGEEFGDAAGKFSGKTLHAEQERLIVQTWRDSKWKKGQDDSILIFRFQPSPKGTELFVTQAGLPDGSIPAIKSFWNLRFWKPIKDFIKAEKRAATPPKPRGRPRKNPITGEAPEKAAKQRGRPRKAATASEAPKRKGQSPNVRRVTAGPVESKSAGKSGTTSRTPAKDKKAIEKTATPATSKRRGRPANATVVLEKKPEPKSGKATKKPAAKSGSPKRRGKKAD